MGKRAAPTQREYFPDRPFEGNKWTKSFHRYQSRMYFLNQLDAGVGGVTNRWLYEAIKANQYAKKYSNIKKIKTPILLFQAGDEQWVKNRSQNRFCKLLNRHGHCTKVYIKQSKHEIFNEIDEVRTEFMNNLFNFLED